MLRSFSIYRETNIIKICLYGFMSGMSLLLSGNTINFWLASFGIDTKIIGLFSCIAMPYAFKYFIALFIDHHQISYIGEKIGHHKSWLIFSQLMITLTLIFTSFLTPNQNLWLIALSGFLIAMFAIIQDIVLNANRIKILNVYQQPAGTAMYSLGYRLGMLFSGAGVIFASIYLSWSIIYLGLAIAYILLTILIFYIYKEPEGLNQDHIIFKNDKSIWYNIFIQPFQHFLALKNFIWVILFIIIYRLADNMLIVMLNPFLLKIGYTAVEIASISKFFGTIMVIIGGIISAPIINKFNIRNSLIGFSILHIFGHLLFIILNLTGKNISLLYFITAYEALTGGMAMTAYISFISGLCKGKHVATQYALLSSGMGASRAIFPIASGMIVDYYGWLYFFIIISFLSAVTILFTYLMPKHLYKRLV